MDVSGSIFENSTCYDIIKFGSLEYAQDYEQKRRFYKPRTLNNEVRPHIFTYRVWFESMNLRYFIEMAFFAACVLFFQYFISSFNGDLHYLIYDLEKLKEYKII